MEYEGVLRCLVLLRTARARTAAALLVAANVLPAPTDFYRPRTRPDKYVALVVKYRESSFVGE
jgi:hypothetical protein